MFPLAWLGVEIRVFPTSFIIEKVQELRIESCESVKHEKSEPYWNFFIIHHRGNILIDILAW